MTRLEMVEKLHEKTGVKYDVAREALENNNWDLLDAIIALKRDIGYEKSAEEPYRPEIVVEKNSRLKEFSGAVGGKFKTAVKFLFSLLGKAENLRIEILCGEEVLGSVSVLVLLLLLMLCWYVPVGLAIVGYFTGYRFRFSSKTLAGKVINGLGERVMDDAEKELEYIQSKYDKE